MIVATIIMFTQNKLSLKFLNITKIRFGNYRFHQRIERKGIYHCFRKSHFTCKAMLISLPIGKLALHHVTIGKLALHNADQTYHRTYPVWILYTQFASPRLGQIAINHLQTSSARSLAHYAQHGGGSNGQAQLLEKSYAIICPYTS